MIASLLIPLKTIYNKIFKITCTVTETLHLSIHHLALILILILIDVTLL
jgi:hypothetical protein